MLRMLRKHRAAFMALVVYNFVLFFPVAFMGRALSPNDVYYGFSPWSSMRPAGTDVQNRLLNDPPTAYFTLMSVMKDDWRAFHWNPYVAAGIPGFGSSAAAMLSPFILLPVLLVPLAWVYTAIAFLKLNASFVFAYLWLREERLGRRGAAIGAIVIAGAGVYAVRWLWQITNATALFPALLWLLRRTLTGKRFPMAIAALVTAGYALAGFPAAMAYGAYLVLAYALRLAPSIAPRNIARAVAATAIGLLIALPSLIPFVQLIRRSGYLELRETTALSAILPMAHWASFFDSERLGNPVYKNWFGDSRLGILNNYVEATVYLGAIVVALALLGLLNRRARTRFFWVGAVVVILACMFGAPFIAPLVAELPGFKYSALARVGLLLPLAIGYLAAAGSALIPRRVRLLQYGLAIWIAFDLALLAGRFHPFLPPEKALVPATPVTKYLQGEKGPFRVAPFFDYLWPNSAELLRIEDIRSHFGSEADYRRMLQRLDPTVFGGRSTVLTLNSLKYNFADPLAAMLGVRWYIEHNAIDIVKWTIFGSTAPAVKETGSIPLKHGTTLERTVKIDSEPYWAIEVPINIEEGRGRLEVTLLRDGAVLWSRAVSQQHANVMNKVYVPVRPHARLGDTLTLRVRANGIKGWTLRGENANPGESPLYYGRVLTPIIFDRELPDGRLFRNLAELPRFWPVSRLHKLNDDEFLARKNIDYAHEAVITDDPVMPPEVGVNDARVTLAGYGPDEQRLIAESSSPFFLASSEKLTPELRISIDGETAKAIETNMLFAGVLVPSGRHEIVFQRRIARGWWWTAIAGLAAWLAVAAWEIISARRR